MSNSSSISSMLRINITDNSHDTTGNSNSNTSAEDDDYNTNNNNNSIARLVIKALTATTTTSCLGPTKETPEVRTLPAITGSRATSVCLELPLSSIHTTTGLLFRVPERHYVTSLASCMWCLKVEGALYKRK